ncbi:MAG: UDP-glucose 4-epimerase [Nitrosopumilales archaeon]|nr:MAG: UDP-glucose 4-epimerase [Nitrosopumilales archaeon]
MKVFVTGGAGFFGATLVASLLKKNYQVIIFDNFSNSSEEKISPLLAKGAKLVEGDITDYKSIENAMDDSDIAIHLAASINVEDSILNPEKTHNVNVDGSINVFRACVANKVRKIIVASSAAVYGEPENLPVSENSPTNPISPYGESKLNMEKYTQKFSQNNNLDCILLRFFNIYGAGQSDAYAGVITKFMKNISENKLLVIFGDGSNTRDFIAIEDVIDSIHNAISNLDGKRGTCYNIASGRHVSIKELAQLMLSISDKKLEIKYELPKKSDIHHSKANIDLAKKELDFHPKISLKEGLEKLLKLN